MQSRVEITGRFAHQYKQASKKQKGRILDEVVSVTGWSRDNARRRLTNAVKPAVTPTGRPSVKVVTATRKPRPGKFSYDARKVLQKVWKASGKQCGKYLTQVMTVLLDNMERHGELVDGLDRYSLDVRAELETMSPATIDRYLAPIKRIHPIRGIAATKPSPLLRTSITVRKAGDEVEAEPGFFEGDTVAHCGPTLKGEFARTVNLTDVFIGWTITQSVRNNANVHIQAALQHAYDTLPYPMAGVDFDNGSEFINYPIVAWANGLDLYFTRSRPYKKNDQATIESKNNHLVRHYADYWRYDTNETLRLLNQLWPLVNDLHNFLTPTKKPIGWADQSSGRKKRIYDTPATPCDRLIASGICSPAQISELLAHRDSLNPALINRKIDQIRTRLTRLAAPRTEELRQTLKPPATPDTTTGIQLRTG